MKCGVIKVVPAPKKEKRKKKKTSNVSKDTQSNMLTSSLQRQEDTVSSEQLLRQLT